MRRQRHSMLTVTCRSWMSFDSIFPFASEWKDSAQDDSATGAGLGGCIRAQIQSSAALATTESCK